MTLRRLTVLLVSLKGYIDCAPSFVVVVLQGSKVVVVALDDLMTEFF